MSRPPRRFPELVGLIPGKANTYGRPKILAVIDTSTSMVFDQFAICNEIERMSKHYDVWWVECDSAGARTVYKWGGSTLKAVEGGGGSALQPAFDRAFLRKHKPDLVVVFTNGMGSLALKAPHFPVIWVLTTNGKRPAPWGRVIRMQESHPKFGDLGAQI